MIKVTYVKFYQPIRVGSTQYSHLIPGNDQSKGVSAVWDSGLLRITSPKMKGTKYVGTGNIVEFDGEEVSAAKVAPEAVGQAAGKKAKA